MEKQTQKKSGKNEKQRKGGKKFEGHAFSSPKEAQKDRETPDDFDFENEKDYRPGKKKDH